MSCPLCHFKTEGRKWQVTLSLVMFDREMLETQTAVILPLFVAAPMLETAVYPSSNPPTSKSCGNSKANPIPFSAQTRAHVGMLTALSN